MSVISANGLFNTAVRKDVVDPAERPKSKLWLNIGVFVNVIDPDTKEERKELMTLPVNLAIDTQKMRELPKGKATTARGVLHRQRVQTSNAILEMLQKAGSNMEPGSIADLDGFSLQLQRVNEDEDPEVGSTPEDNPILAQVMGTFGIKTE